MSASSLPAICRMEIYVDGGGRFRSHGNRTSPRSAARIAARKYADGLTPWSFAVSRRL
jgi:hypothetical protein